MYGLVNKAIQDFTTAELGPEGWEKVCKEAEVKGEFVSMCPYSDGITYRLVGAAAAELGRPAAAVLEAFGEFWITYSAREGYGELLEFWGDDFVSFVENIDGLHARLRFTFPELQPPQITCTRIAEHTLEIEYHSEREGLAPFFAGLLKGLGKRFDEALEVEHRGKREDHGHDTFVVSLPGRRP